MADCCGLARAGLHARPGLRESPETSAHSPGGTEKGNEGIKGVWVGLQRGRERKRIDKISGGVWAHSQECCKVQRNGGVCMIPKWALIAIGLFHTKIFL